MLGRITYLRIETDWFKMGARCSKGSELPSRDPSFFKRTDVPLDEFEVIPENKVAEYDHEELTKYWNKGRRNDLERRSLLKALLTNWRRGVWGTSLRVILLYIVSYYIVNYFVIQQLCARDYPTQFTIQTPYQTMMLEAMAQRTNQTTGTLSITNTTLTRAQELARNFTRHGCTNYEAMFASFAAK